MDKENLDKKNFIKLISESEILSSDQKKNMPDFSPLIQRGAVNYDDHKRFRNQKSIFYCLIFSAILFQNRPETFNGSYENINSRKSLKEGVQNFLKGSITENEFRNVLEKNKINPDSNEIRREIQSATLNGAKGKNLLNSVLKYNPEK